MKRKFKYFLFFFIGSFLFSCAGDEETVRTKDTDFFPVQKDLFWTYQVDEKQYTPLDGEKDFLYDLKYQVTDSFPNSAGGFTYVLDRSKRTDPGGKFEYLDTWSARIEASQVIVSEGNVPYVKLSFPLTKGKQWNGNAFNTLGGDETCGEKASTPCDKYEIESVNEPYDRNGLTFAQTVNVLQNNNQDIIVKKDVRREIYARNVGLVYKESTVLAYCTVGDCVGQQQIESGYIITQTLTAYGKE